MCKTHSMFETTYEYLIKDYFMVSMQMMLMMMTMTINTINDDYGYGYGNGATVCTTEAKGNATAYLCCTFKDKEFNLILAI